MTDYEALLNTERNQFDVLEKDLREKIEALRFALKVTTEERDGAIRALSREGRKRGVVEATVATHKNRLHALLRGFDGEDAEAYEAFAEDVNNIYNELTTDSPVPVPVIVVKTSARLEGDGWDRYVLDAKSHDQPPLGACLLVSLKEEP
jgi:hypothetical protein